MNEPSAVGSKIPKCKRTKMQFSTGFFWLVGHKAVTQHCLTRRVFGVLGFISMLALAGCATTSSNVGNAQQRDKSNSVTIRLQRSSTILGAMWAHYALDLGDTRTNAYKTVENGRISVTPKIPVIYHVEKTDQGLKSWIEEVACDPVFYLGKLGRGGVLSWTRRPGTVKLEIYVEKIGTFYHMFQVEADKSYVVDYTPAFGVQNLNFEVRELQAGEQVE